ncbi:DUF721 domain-containing protein [Streptomyces sp. NPDC002680]|uniref:DUF721 domain-containing protein n=1 Tax=Streptomyces sp. NPDC002680 TaxID=3364659 RepID=UPI00369A0AE2
MGLGAAIGALVTERAWELPAAGATLRQRWEAIAPELAGHVTAVGYDPDSGRLTVCPESAAWATKVRLEQPRIIKAANASAGRTVMRGLRILAPGSVSAPVEDVVQAPEAPKGTGEDTEGGQRRLPPRPRRPPAGSPAPPGRPGYRSGSRAADPRDARAQSARVPRAGSGASRCAGPDRDSPRPTPPRSRRHPRGCPTPGPRGTSRTRL